MVLKDWYGLTLTIHSIFGRGRNRQVKFTQTGYPDMPKWMRIGQFATRIVEDVTPFILPRPSP